MTEHTTEIHQIFLQYQSWSSSSDFTTVDWIHLNVQWKIVYHFAHSPEQLLQKARTVQPVGTQPVSRHEKTQLISFTKHCLCQCWGTTQRNYRTPDWWWKPIVSSCCQLQTIAAVGPDNCLCHCMGKTASFTRPVLCLSVLGACRKHVWKTMIRNKSSSTAHCLYKLSVRRPQTTILED